MLNCGCHWLGIEWTLPHRALWQSEMTQVFGEHQRLIVHILAISHCQVRLPEDNVPQLTRKWFSKWKTFEQRLAPLMHTPEKKDAVDILNGGGPWHSEITDSWNSRIWRRDSLLNFWDLTFHWITIFTGLVEGKIYRKPWFSPSNIEFSC